MFCRILYKLDALPITALAAWLIFMGTQILNLPALIETLRKANYGIAIYLVTFAGVILINVLTGVIIGFLASLVRLFYQLSLVDVSLELDSVSRADIRLSGIATFLALPKIIEALDRVPHHYKLHVHVEDLSFIDHTCLDAFANWETNAKKNNGRLQIEWHELVQKIGKAQLVKI